MITDPARELALKVIVNIEQNGAYSSVHLNSVFKKENIRSIDKAFVSEIVYGVIRHKIYLDYVIQQFSTVKIKKMTFWILNILRIGFYQILFMNKVPYSAACNESVKLAKKYGHNASAGFVNAVIRGMVRNIDAISYPDRNNNFEEYLSIRYSFPKNLTHRWIEIFGDIFTEELMAASNVPPKLTIRVNTLKIDASSLKSLLQEKGFKVSGGKYCEEALVIENPSSIYETEEFRKGLFYTQDESSMIAVKALAPKQGDFIIDLCGAPGGKSTHIAQLMNDKGRILSRDVYPHKIKLIEENAHRLGINIIESEIWNAVMIDETLLKKADAVIADCPCSGYGVIRKKPEIKWARCNADIEEIISIQKYILRSASEYVRPGGTLLYSTCTIEPPENEDQISQFIKDNDDFYLEDLNPYLPESLRRKSAENGYITLYSNMEGVDGFFIARMTRKTKES